MKIIVLGAGFTGLTAAFRLSQQGHEVVVLEKDEKAGGLASGFQKKGWSWTLEKSYHHWFTNDQYALSLASEIGQKVIIKRPSTATFIKNTISVLDSPTSLLTFTFLPLVDRLRMGFSLLYLKLVTNPEVFHSRAALSWIRRFMGNNAARLIWEPLFQGKFGHFKESIALTWFWARIKKRTASLAYPEGGFLNFAIKIMSEVEKHGGKVLLNSEVKTVSCEKGCYTIKTTTGTLKAETVISTLPTPVFIKLFPSLPKEYTQKISSIQHLHALNLILILKEPFLKETYWLNITDTDFPFLVLAEHTNFMDPKHYGNQHILYIGNYLPENHPYLKMSASELLKIYSLFLKKINPNYEPSTISYELFASPFAQPIMTLDYSSLMPKFETPLKGVYMANLDMVYPWDRGTNYAIELGEKVAEMINKENQKSNLKNQNQT